MAAFDFPNSPNTNDKYTANGMTFIWNGSVWKKDASAGTKGEKGQKGEKGEKGQKGEVGLSGGAGGKGEKGEKGQKGQNGNDATGTKGQKGEVGQKGQKGEDNSTKGQKGEIGVADKGQKGEVGTTVKGQKGELGNVTAAIPSGGIIIWSGAANAIPSGWYLCNGSNGTPDLRGRFVVGYSNTDGDFDVNDTGGSKDAVVVTHDHDADASSNVSDPGHRHPSRGFGTDDDGGDQHTGSGNNSVRNNAIEDATTGINVATNIDIDNEGESGTNKNLPPYYALAYIMKS